MTRSLILACLLALPLLASQPVVFHLEPYRDTVAVHAKVGGHDGFFTFDTGGGITLITPQFAEKIGCVPFGRLTGYAMMGNRIDAARCDDVPVAIGQASLVAPAAAVYDVMSFFPKDAQPVDGSIALNALDGKAFTIDFPARTVTIETDASLKKRVRGATELPVHLQREAQGHALAVSVGVPSAKGLVWMELDSGNSRTILISKIYAPLFGLNPELREPQKVDFPLAGNLRVKSDRAFPPDMIIDGNLGMPFLKDMVVTIDFRASRLWVRRAVD
jgi:hypothetical protein